MAEKTIRRFAAVDEDGKQYEIEEYVLVVTTTQLSDSHLAEERSPPRYRLSDGRAVKLIDVDVWQLDGGHTLRPSSA